MILPHSSVNNRKRKKRKRSRAQQKKRRTVKQGIRKAIAEYLGAGAGHFPKGVGPKLYTWLKNVAIAYSGLGPHDALHLQRRTLCRAAIAAAFNKMPAVSLPFNGNVNKALKVALPALEAAFRMPPTRPPQGTPAWIRYMCENLGDATFLDLSLYDEIFKAFLQQQRRQGDHKGRPRVLPGESLEFNEVYTAPSKQDRGANMLSPTVSTPHIHLPGQRRVSHNQAITKLRNAGFWPCAVSAKNCPTGQPYDNFVKVRYKYWIEYCIAEGLTRSNDRARRALLYVFYAKPVFRGKPSDVIRIIHTGMFSGTHRFGNANAPKCFARLLNILQKNKAAKTWLTDRGANKNVPVPYLAAVGYLFTYGHTYSHVWPYAHSHMAIRTLTYGHTHTHIWPYVLSRMAIRTLTYGHTHYHI